jgi:hypothetical protein
MKKPPLLGTTFSQLQCAYLSLDYTETLDALLTLPLDVYRVCAYWNEIESIENTYNFEILDTIIGKISEANKQIVLSVGIKAPRWPEFHFPRWIKDEHDVEKRNCALDTAPKIATKGYEFTKKVLERYIPNPKVKYLLIENEGLNNASFTSGRYLSYAFVNSEVFLARSLKRPDQKILCNNAIDLVPPWPANDEDKLNLSLTLSDAVGINVYTKVPITDSTYLQPNFIYWWKLRRWLRKIQKADREPWITEAQAEPWEKHNGQGSVVHIDQLEYPSASPEKAIALVSKLAHIGFPNILMWGSEYWYWHKAQGRNEWWNAITELGTES